MPIPRHSLTIIAAAFCLTMTSCSTFTSRSPENAGGQVAKAGPFVGSRFAYNNLYGRGESRTDHLPKKILSPLILIADGGSSAVADVFMLPFDWNGSTVPAADPRRTPRTERVSEQELRDRMKRRAAERGVLP